MDIKMTIQDNNTGKLHDISNLVGNININWQLAGQPGKLTFDFVRTPDNTAFFYEGSVVTLQSANQDVFYGYVFSKVRNKEQIITVTAYDQMRYLKNQDTNQFNEKTSSEIFQAVCSKFNLKYSVIDASSYKLPKVVYDNKNLYAMIADALDKTLIAQKVRYIVRDNYGTLEHVNIDTLKTNLTVGDKTMLLNYEYESSVDSGVYNQVYLIKEDSNSGKRKEYQAKDDKSINKWGILQYHNIITDEANDAQMQQMANNRLFVSNALRRMLAIDCIGDFRVREGSGITIAIKGLGDINLDQMCAVHRCNHSIRNGIHTMRLEVEPLWQAKS